ncbi:MAG: D-alanyl-D-alanine carboxypeptidase/D-alanyl-D-alanine-endopeptidase [Gemmatimonadota bacterium]|nr:D-alanyl-D-alanine carboxypeptidase/D-alanyl-D-alanine-endopeptidase [Gemmatimonadota bacterium]
MRSRLGVTALLALGTGCAAPATTTPPTTTPAPQAAAAPPAAAQESRTPTPGTATPLRRATHRELTRFSDSLLTDPMFRSANWGVLIVDPVAGDTLYSRNAGKLFMPASNQKLLTGATALAQLGPDFRYETRVLGAAYPVSGILTGDLAIVGSGDPSFSDSLAGDAMAPLRALADSLAARGISEITGRLIRGGDAFPDSTLGYGWAWDDLDYGYSAPVDELFFNEGYATIAVFGGAAPGAPVTVRTGPARGMPHIGRVDVVTGAWCCTERARVQWNGDVRGVHPAVNLTGSVRPGDSVTVSVAIRNPAAAWLDAFAEALADRGIAVRGGVESAEVADTTGMSVLATHTSPPLRDILRRFEKPSQNQIGELLFKTLGLVRTGSGTADSGRAVVERQLLAWGADSTGFAVRDGSGLSRHDYVSPETIVKVLDAMRRHPDFQVFYDALPIGGVDGTIEKRMIGTAAANNVRAKTGTLDKARSLSGYVTAGDGRLLLFSILANNHVVANREVERVQDAIVALLATLRAGDR